MATSSFDKVFILRDKKEAESFTKMILNPRASVKIDRTLTSPEKKKRGELKLEKMLSR